MDLSTLPNFCSHEHWGLILPFPGSANEEGVEVNFIRGATTPLRTGLTRVLWLPGLQGAWYDPNNQFGDWSRLDLNAARERLHSVLPEYELTGGYQCLRRGILKLHGGDVSENDANVWQALDDSIAEHYADYHAWNQEAMQRVNFSHLLRPVEPEYFVRVASQESAQAEKVYCSGLLRIEALMSFWPATEANTTNPAQCTSHWGLLPKRRRDALAELTGIMPADTASWREFLTRLFDAAAENGCVGLKQMQAYNRPLDYQIRSDADVRWTPGLNAEEIIIWQDWVLHEICKQAEARGWPFQIHSGTHNLPHSNPLPLCELAQRYPKMPVVLLHCWPFLDEVAYLAQRVENIHVDSCWLPILNPDYYRRAMRAWLNYVPTTKIMCSHDAHSVEEAAGSALFTREILGKLLDEQHKTLGIPEERLLAKAEDILHNNAARLYKCCPFTKHN